MNNTPCILKRRITLEQAGLRLDQCPMHSLSRSRLKVLILQGKVTVDGITISDPATLIRGGQDVKVMVPPCASAQLRPQDIPLNIVYEDADIIVLDKPAGIVVHPAPGSLDTTVVNALLFHCGHYLSSVGECERPGIVHRLDKDTTGLLIVAKTESAYYSLTEQFAGHYIERAYQAIVWGVLHPLSGVIAGNIGRHPVNRKKMAIVRGSGKPALTYYHVIKTFDNTASLIECRLATGRTHQVRIHMASIGHSLIGDKVYSHFPSLRWKDKKSAVALLSFPRQALHACLISFHHPRTGSKLLFESELPSDIRVLTNFLESKSNL